MGTSGRCSIRPNASAAGHADSSVGGIGIGVPNPQRATGEVELPDDLTTES